MPTAERQFEDVADSAPVLLWIADVEGLCTFFNSTWLTFTGRTLEQESGCGWAEGIHPDDRDRCLVTLAEAFGARERFEIEYRLRRHDGAYRWLLGRGAPRFTRDGAFSGYIGSCVDVTDSKLLEQELRSAVRDRDAFLSIAAHELRTPLTSLHLQLESLARAIGKMQPAPDRLKRSSDGALRQTRRLMALVEQLLDVSNLTLGRLGLSLGDVDLVPVVVEVIERFQPIARDAGCTLTFVGPAALRGRWDRERLDQIVSNLVSNAVKYGRGTPVKVSLAEDGGGAVLVVEDQGIGIAAEDQQRIFERFERAAAAQGYGGFGLGLWIARELVQAHGGALSVASAPGRGATFTVELPKSLPLAAPPGA